MAQLARGVDARKCEWLLAARNVLYWVHSSGSARRNHGHTSKHTWFQSTETYGFTRCLEMFRVLQAGVCRCTVDPLTKDLRPRQTHHCRFNAAGSRKG